MEKKFKQINKEDMKEGTLVQYCGFYILDAKKLKEAGFEPKCFFVEE
ncbi:unnamed protein product [marine sediment metagenome]|uniref:Uncharacterized protein n=1 Tax=marine sediment metagenome TaxID=412755 RepID=X1GCY4_9ZZZZ